MGRLLQSILLLVLILPLLIACSGRLVPASMDFEQIVRESGEEDYSVSPPLEIRKEFRLHSAPKQHLIQADNLLFVPTSTGRIETYDLNREEKIGNMKLPNSSQAGLTVVNGQILISLEFGKESLFLFEPEKDRRVWTAELGSIATRPLVRNNKVYIGSLYRGVFCVSLDSGTVLWQVDLGSQLHKDPLILSDKLIQGTETGKLVALSLTDGEEMWEHDLKSPISSALASSQGKIIACTFDGRVVAVSEAGKLLWERRLGTEVRRDITAWAEWLTLAGQDGVVRTLTTDDGLEVWQFDTDTVIGTSPVKTAEFIVFGTLDKRLIFLSSSTGAHIWELELYGRIRTDPVIWKDRLIVGSENNNLYIFDSATMTN